MKEIIFDIISVVIVFCLIGMIESVMLFEKIEKNGTNSQSSRMIAMKGRDLWKY